MNGGTLCTGDPVARTPMPCGYRLWWIDVTGLAVTEVWRLIARWSIPATATIQAVPGRVRLEWFR